MRLRFALPLLLLPSLAAQSPSLHQFTAGPGPSRAGAMPDLATTLPEAHGLERDEAGCWHGIATRFVARFDHGGIVYTPALGRAAAVDQPWSFALAAVGREATSQSMPAVAPERVGDSIHYRHAGMLERYTVSAAGIKQDFVFDRLPPGRGDLVVRGRVTTTLLPAAPTAAGMQFTLAGAGGVQVGAVVGIDARGQRCHGQLEWHDGELSCRLPESFVVRAELPLTGDPQLGTILTTSAAATNIDWLDAAHDPDANGGAGAWFVVWQSVLSASNSNIYGLRILSGAFFGSVKGIEVSATTNSYAPRVATNNRLDNWVVVYGAGQSVFTRSYWAADVLHPTLTVSTSGVWPAVGGDSRTTGGGITMLAWADSAAGQVLVRPLTQALSHVAPQLGATATVSTQYGGTGPIDISRHGGNVGQWLIVYPHFDTFSTVRLFARVWNGTTFASSAFNLGAPPSSSLIPSVDGDGDDWVVAWRQPEASSPTDGDILARSVRLRSTGTALGTTTTLTGLAARDEYAPSVAWLGDSALVAWSREGAIAGQIDSQLRSIDTLACAACEGTWSLDTNSIDVRPRVAASCSGSSWTGTALAVWRGDSSAGGAVAQFFQAADGLVTPLLGGCGQGGEARASCPRSPNANFRFHLHRAAPAATAFLLLGDVADSLPCGGCTLLVDPAAAVIVAAPTSTVGTAELAMPIPSAAGGRELRAQWAVLGTGCAGLLDLSGGLQFAIQ